MGLLRTYLVAFVFYEVSVFNRNETKHVNKYRYSNGCWFFFWDKNLRNSFRLCVTEITLSSSSSQLIDIPHTLSHCLHVREEKSVHLYVIPSPLPVSKGEQSRHRTFLIQEIIVYPKAKYHSELHNTTTLSASLETQHARVFFLGYHPPTSPPGALPNIKN